MKLENLQKKVTKEERQKIGKIVQVLSSKLNDEKVSGCCSGKCQCCGTLCWDIWCKSCFGIQKNCKKRKKSKEIITPSLEKAITFGMRALWTIIYPLFPSVLRDVWVSVEFILIFVSFSLSLVQLIVTGNPTGLVIVHFILAVIALGLATMDAIVQLTEFRSCKACCRICKGKRHKEDKNGLTPGRDDQTKLKYICCNICCDRSTAYGKAVLWSRDFFDIIRAILSELIIFPLTLFDIFELILCKGWESKDLSDRLSLTLFIVSSISLVLFVYVLRSVFLLILLLNTQRTRQKLVDISSQDKKQNGSTTKRAPSISVVTHASGKWLSGYFIIHVLFQMFGQIFMIIAIGSKFQYENRNYDSDQNVHISVYLWFMIVAGYLLPFYGIFTFFIVNFYWVREFPIQLYIEI